jgi:N-acetylneuraminate lyase
MKTTTPLHGLIAAPHTPFAADGSLNLPIVEKQAALLLANGVTIAFIGGTTGEMHSLSLDERRALTQRWSEVSHGTALRVVVHAGANCLADGRALAAQAQQLKATAIAAVAPSYFKPRSVDLLVDCMAEIASGAPALPFYYYEIPSFTGVTLSASEFLEKGAQRIPNLAGLKFTSNNLMEYQLCLRAAGGTLDVAFGFDEMLLAALSMGARGAVGSTYNFAAPIYHRLIAAFESGDLDTARREQFRSVQMVQVLVNYGFMGAAKAVMAMLGVNVGPARLPNGSLTPEQSAKLRGDLERIGFFEWIRPQAA